MPKEMEDALKKEAKAKFGSLDTPSAKKYVFGPLGRYERKHGLKKKKKK